MLNKDYEEYRFEQLYDLLIIAIRQINSSAYKESRTLLGVMLEIVENHLRKLKEVQTA